MIGTPQERFWAKVEKTDTCWLWQGNLNRQNYGQFWLHGKLEKAHRASWEFEHGKTPSGLQVCHHCDVPSCVNPAHLFLGTNQDNALDYVRKGKWWTPKRLKTLQPKGEQHG